MKIKEILFSAWTIQNKTRIFGRTKINRNLTKLFLTLFTDPQVILRCGQLLDMSKSLLKMRSVEEFHGVEMLLLQGNWILVQGCGHQQSQKPDIS